jgi:hypothetical protein
LLGFELLETLVRTRDRPRNSVFIGTYRGYVRFSSAPTLAGEAAQETAPAE